jgi:hypothetical protein
MRRHGSSYPIRRTPGRTNSGGKRRRAKNQNARAVILNGHSCPNIVG